MKEEFEDTKGVIRIRKWKKNRQRNREKKKHKRTNKRSTEHYTENERSDLYNGQISANYKRISLLKLFVISLAIARKVPFWLSQGT
jgi:hypothetical protein